jgi:hypothetical protein
VHAEALAAISRHLAGLGFADAPDYNHLRQCLQLLPDPQPQLLGLPGHLQQQQQQQQLDEQDQDGQQWGAVLYDQQQQFVQHGLAGAMDWQQHGCGAAAAVANGQQHEQMQASPASPLREQTPPAAGTAAAAGETSSCVIELARMHTFTLMQARVQEKDPTGSHRTDTMRNRPASSMEHRLSGRIFIVFSLLLTSQQYAAVMVDHGSSHHKSTCCCCCHSQASGLRLDQLLTVSRQLSAGGQTQLLAANRASLACEWRLLISCTYHLCRVCCYTRYTRFSQRTQLSDLHAKQRYVCQLAIKECMVMSSQQAPGRCYM